MRRARAKSGSFGGGLFDGLAADGAASAAPDDARVAAHLSELARPGADGVSLRTRQGSHYTPASLVEWVLDEALLATSQRNQGVPQAVFDPSCGAGNFLVAAAKRLTRADGPRITEVLARSVFGIDVDAVAVELCRARLRGLVPHDATEAERAAVDAALARHVVVGDALEGASIEGLLAGAAAPPREGAFDLVVGNPPFLNQLGRATTASRVRAAALRARFGGAIGGYADLAGAFLLEALRAVRAGGAVGFVMPQSFLAAADAGAVRARALEQASMCALWTANERLFEDASVRVMAVVLCRSGDAGSRPLRRAFGAGFRPLQPCAVEMPARDDPWSPLLSDAIGVPARAASSAAGDGVAVIGSIARATADFRDQFYGLRGALRDLAEPPSGVVARFPRLISTRHVDLARESWGAVDARILGARYRNPRVDLAALAEVRGMIEWAEARLTPKVLVATQTKVVEAVVDAEGAWLPLVPLITVTLRGDAIARGIDLWMLAAAVASPIVVAHAAARFYGTALSGAAIKLSARQLLEMPLPTVHAPWRESAEALREAAGETAVDSRRAALERFARASCAAHGLAATDADAVFAFWLARL